MPFASLFSLTVGFHRNDQLGRNVIPTLFSKYISITILVEVCPAMQSRPLHDCHFVTGYYICWTYPKDNVMHITQTPVNIMYILNRTGNFVLQYIALRFYVDPSVLQYVLHSDFILILLCCSILP